MMTKQDGENKIECSVGRFISYHAQLEEIFRLQPPTILDVGIGNRTIDNFIERNSDMKVTTADLNQKLNPDKVADVRELPFEDNSFDMVVCCSTIQLIPRADFAKALQELRRVSRRWILVGIPHPTFLTFELMVRAPLLKTKSLRLAIPFLRARDNDLNGWGLGRDVPTKVFRQHAQQGMKIIKEFRPMLMNHHYFLLEKV